MVTCQMKKTSLSTPLIYSLFALTLFMMPQPSAAMNHVLDTVEEERIGSIVQVVDESAATNTNTSHAHTKKNELGWINTFFVEKESKES